MGMLGSFIAFVVAVAAGIFFYDKQLLAELGTQAVHTVSNKTNEVYLDYYESLYGLYFEPEKKYAFYAQIFALATMVYVVVLKRAYDPAKKGYGGRAPTPLSKQEQDTLIDEWEPEPLINIGIDTRPNELGDELVLTTRLGATVEIEGIPEPVLNLSGFDFLGMSQVESIREKSKECLEVYGCGSCGPRGFYGTSDQHLDLETAIKDFFGTEEAIVYSDAACTMSSIIPAFAKRGDAVIADIAVSESALSGIELSRSNVKYFKHNDMADLAAQLEKMTNELKRKGKPLSQVRRYIVVEGLYRNLGDFAPLTQILALAKRFKYRVILDDSYGIGAVGATGRGSLERAGLKATDVDFLAGSLAYAFGSIGGFCTGSHVAVDHQRLAGSGYCFSASAPPFTCVAALEAIRLVDNDPSSLNQLQENVALAFELANDLPGVTVISEADSPMIYLTLEDEESPGDDKDERYRMEKRLQGIVDAALEGGVGAGAAGNRSTGGRRRSKRVSIKDTGGGGRVLVSRARSVYPPAKSKRPPLPDPSIRITVSAYHTEEDLRAAFATLSGALQ